MDATPQLSSIEVQMTGVDNKQYALHLPFLDAMRLLDFLRQAKTQAGWKFPEER